MKLNLNPFFTARVETFPFLHLLHVCIIINTVDDFVQQPNCV